MTPLHDDQSEPPDDGDGLDFARGLINAFVIMLAIGGGAWLIVKGVQALVPH